MQTDLQLLLLIIGLVFGGFILYNTFRNKAKKRSSSFEEFEPPTNQVAQYTEPHDPLLDDYKESKAQVAQSLQAERAPQPDFLEPEHSFALEPLLESENQPDPKVEPVVAPQPAKPELIALSIIPKQLVGFTGAMLLAGLKAHQFYYGEHQIFHRHVNDSPKEAILFSIASLVEPGYFEYHQMFNKTFPGILIWMMLPTSADAMQTFDKMLRSARQLAAFLQGELCDTKRLLLTTEAIATMRERVHQFQVKHEQQVEYELEDAE